MKEKSSNYILKVVVWSFTAVVTFGFFHHKQQPTKWWVLYRTVCSPFQMFSSSVSVGIEYISVPGTTYATRNLVIWYCHFPLTMPPGYHWEY